MKAIAKPLILYASFLIASTIHGQELIPVHDENLKYGYIDKTGKEVIPMKYSFAGRFVDGLALVGINYMYGFIDKTGKEIIPLKYNYASDFSEGLAKVKVKDKYGFVDKMGNETIPAKYDYVGDFTGGLAVVELNKKNGFINKKGEEIIALKYDRAYPFNEGFALVALKNKYGFIDTSGNEAIPLKYDDAGGFYEGFAAVSRNYQWGFINKTGQEVIPLKYGGVWGFSEGLARVQLNGKYGFIDRSGREIIPLKYDDADFFSEGLARVMIGDSKSGKYGFVDTSDKTIIPIQYNDIGRYFTEGLTPVKLNGKYGFIDRSNKIIITPEYDNAENFSSGFAEVKQYNRAFYINKTGKVFTPGLQRTCSIELFNRMADAIHKNDLVALKNTTQNTLFISGFVERKEKSLNRFKPDSAQQGESCVEYLSEEKFGFVRSPFIIRKFESGALEVYRNMKQEEVNFIRDELRKAEASKKGWKFSGTNGIWEIWENGNVIFYLPARDTGSGGDTNLFKKPKRK